MTIDNSEFYNFPQSVFRWVADRSIYKRTNYEETVGLNMNVTDCEFTTTVMDGFFDSSETSSNTFIFTTNKFYNYDSYYANDYLFFLNNTKSTVLFDFISNEWYNLDIYRWIVSDGPNSFRFYTMTIDDNTDFLYAVDPKYILFETVIFCNFQEIITIDRKNGSMLDSDPFTMSMDMKNCNIENNLTVNNGNDSQVIYIYNMLPTDNIHLYNSNFKGRSFINVTLD